MTGLVLVWSMPAVVAVQVWYWMTNFQNGVVNYILTQLHLGDFEQHDWYATTFSKLAMVTLLIVWGALPFVDDHALRGARAGAARARRGCADRRREPLARVPRHHVPHAQADLLHPHEPVDHLGLRRVHAAVSPDRRVTRGLVELPDGRLRLHRGLRALRLRPRRRDLDPDAADRRGAERRLRPRHGAEEESRERRAASASRRAALAAPSRTWRRVRRSGLEPPRDRALPRDGLPGLLDGLDGVQAGRRDQQRDADVVLALADARALPRRDGPALLLGHGARTA